MKLWGAAAVAVTTTLTLVVGSATGAIGVPSVEMEETTTTTTTVEETTTTEAATTTEATTTTEGTSSTETSTTTDGAGSGEGGSDTTSVMIVVDDSTTVAPSSNPNQVDQSQAVVVTATVVADANTGSNTAVDNQPAQGGSQQPAIIDTGEATAVGSDDENVITQSADVILSNGATANVLQIALILNIGAAFSNSGFNAVGSAPGGSGTSGAIGTGDATATGLDIDQYITQASEQTGDEDTDAASSQVVVSLWMGASTANTGGNAVAGTGVAGSGGAVGTGNATAVGNDSLTEVEQYAQVLGMDQSTINVTQRATVLNVGFAVANSGLNEVSGVASGLLTATDADDDALAQQLFAMLLPALLQSQGYGPGQGSINSGDATAIGNQSETFVRQVALAASSGDGVVDIVQEVLVANAGVAGANSGGNSLGSIRTLDPETANAVVTMAAFMAELLSLVHQSANATAFNATSQGIEIPFQGLILRLDGAFESLDSQVSQGGVNANLRQVSIVVSLGIGGANSGGNVTESEIQQGNTVNSLQAGDAIAVLPSNSHGNIKSGDATAGNEEVVVICQRINADDVDCLAPPTTTIPPTTAPPTTTPAGPTTTVDPATPTTAGPVTSVGGAGGTTSTTIPVPTTAAPAGGAGTIPRVVPTGVLPATGTGVGESLAVGSIVLACGFALVLMTRTRTRSAR